jgi:hypothetical protein
MKKKTKAHYFKKVRKELPPATKVIKDRKKEAAKKACRKWKKQPEE